MTDTNERDNVIAKLHEILDWAVFSLGAASLFVAVSATVVTRTGLLG